MALKYCPECGGKNAGDRETCFHCGYTFSKKNVPNAYCPECEEWVTKTMDGFCPECGYAFDEAAKQASNGTSRSVVDHREEERRAKQDAETRQKEEECRQYMSIDRGVLYRYTGQQPVVYVPSDVERIENDAFRDCQPIKNIVIPDSVREIGDSAFRGCTSLIKVELPDSITELGEFAFYDCTALTTVKLPDGLKKLQTYAFGHCYALKRIDLPDSLTELGDMLFFECSALTSVSLPPLNAIEESMFDYCKSLQSISIPSTVTVVKSDAFDHCESLESVVLPNGVTRIESSAFRACHKLLSVTIPRSVTFIGYHVMYECYNIGCIKYLGTKKQWESIKKDSDWAYGINYGFTCHCVIKCTDGDIPVKPR